MGLDPVFSKVHRISRRNRRLTENIINIAQQAGDIAQAVKKLLKKLYHNITDMCEILCQLISIYDFGLAVEIVLDTWRTFFQPIEALRQLPTCGEFVAARMLLYFGREFYAAPDVYPEFDNNTIAKDTAPLYEFIADLDDALLEPLKKLWTLSGNRERFDWVFMSYFRHDFRKTVGALSPQELEDLGGIQGEEYWFDDSEGAGEYTLYTGPMPRWDCGEQDWDDFKWKSEGSDGPIDVYLEYSLYRDDIPHPIGCGIAILRRSHQLCRDGRQKSEAHIGRQQHQAFDQVARRHRLPPEMRNRILGYVEYRDPFHYLEKLDLAEAYAPFPKVGGNCTYCDTIEGESTANRTCPQKVMHVWNPALRQFHTFHKNNCQTWSLCARHDCTGHHNQDDWEVKRDPEFTVYLESQAARGNADFVSLDQVGLGPMNPIRIKVADDGVRENALFRGNGIYHESGEDVRMIGGLGGLKDAMIHGRTLTAVWEGGDDELTHRDGAKDMPTTWQHGRNLYSEKVAKEVMRGLHSEADCEWCVNVPDYEFPPIPI